jgi:cytoskeletal protein CcmA (bactofilin family)
MAIWKEVSKTEPALGQPEVRDSLAAAETASRPKAPLSHDPKESIIGAGLTIEGKIDGHGDIRIAGGFKGDVRVKGNLTIESGAHLSGEISADTVTVAGEVEGNISASTHVKLLESGQLVGDLKATSLTVAAGSRMRGRVEFGWDEKEAKRVEPRKLSEDPEKRPLQ